ncbi:MAG: hypothetical protein HRU24_16930 [Gammaproteobacteria bacterium]|nr:hypothetical protein [Gammaproteobacteria bacterium]
MIKFNKLCATLLFICPAVASANNIDFTLGSGLPYVAIVEASVASNNNTQRWFGNYKIGLDDGFSIGVEQAFGQGDNHAAGLIIGAFGVQTDPRPCEKSSESTDSLTNALTNALGCVISLGFSEESTEGVALSYSYHFSGINQKGWKIRLEAGYGKGSRSGEKRGDGSFIVAYQF